MMENKPPKYKTGDYITITGNCKPNLLGTVAQISQVFKDDYMIRMRLFEMSHDYRPWSRQKCEEGSRLNFAMMALYGKT